MSKRTPRPELNLDDVPEVGLSLPPVQPRAGLRSELMARIAATPRFKPAHLVRAGEGAWLDSGVDGVQYRPLYQDPATQHTTLLMKMAPGARYPSHHHGDDEQCLVLEGDVCWADQVYRAGDFIVAARETVHPDIHTVGGNLLLLILGHNEFMHA